MNLILEILFVLLLIFLNGGLALAEISIVSSRKARLQQRAEDGSAPARAALDLVENPSDLLSTVQVGITLVGVLSGAFGGATIAEKLGEWLSRIPALQAYSEAIAVGVVVVMITYLSLVLGELAPKRLALLNPELNAIRVAPTMQRLAHLGRPLVHLLGASTSLVLRLIGVKPSIQPPVTEEEIKVMIDQGTQAGVFAEYEQDMLEAVLRLGDRRVDTLSTPRTQITWLNLEDSLEDNLQVVRTNDHDYFPLARGSLDDVLGIVQARDILALSLAGEDIDLQQVMSEALFVPESTTALELLDLFRKKHQQIALVLDEYGGLQGMLTAYDIMEEIVGELPAMGVAEQLGVVERADGTMLIDGRLPVDELKDALRIPALPGEERGYYQTVGGMMMTILGRIPHPSDRFEWGEWLFEVVDMDGMRVDKVLASPRELKKDSTE